MSEGAPIADTPNGGQENIDPACLAHSKKKSEHVCITCCLCFKSLTHEECSFLPSGTRTNVCVPCAEMEDKAGLQLIETLRADKARLEGELAHEKQQRKRADGFRERLTTKHRVLRDKYDQTLSLCHQLVDERDKLSARVLELEQYFASLNKEWNIQCCECGVKIDALQCSCGHSISDHFRPANEHLGIEIALNRAEKAEARVRELEAFVVDYHSPRHDGDCVFTDKADEGCYECAETDRRLWQQAADLIAKQDVRELEDGK